MFLQAIQPTYLHAAETANPAYPAVFCWRREFEALLGFMREASREPGILQFLAKADSLLPRLERTCQDAKPYALNFQVHGPCYKWQLAKNRFILFNNGCQLRFSGLPILVRFDLDEIITVRRGSRCRWRRSLRRGDTFGRRSWCGNGPNETRRCNSFRLSVRSPCSGQEWRTASFGIQSDNAGKSSRLREIGSRSIGQICFTSNHGWLLGILPACRRRREGRRILRWLSARERSGIAIVGASLWRKRQCGADGRCSRSRGCNQWFKRRQAVVSFTIRTCAAARA